MAVVKKNVRIKISIDDRWVAMEMRRGYLVLVNALETKWGIYPRTSQLRAMYRSGRIGAVMEEDH